MKKLILISVILLQGTFLFAQGSLQMLTHEGAELDNGQTIEVMVEDLSAWETVSDEYFVRNNSAIDLNIKMRMEAVSLVDGADYSFCALGNCFPAGVNETPQDFAVLAGVTVGEGGVFTGHYHPSGHAGTSLIRYTFFNVDNLNDTISFMISFNGSPVSENSLQMLTTDGDLIENGHTIEVIVDDLTAWETVSEEYFVRNNSANDLNIKMRMEAVSLVDGADYSFCALGNCFPAGVNETPQGFAVLAGVTVGEGGVFTGHYHPDGHAGTSLIRYTFFNIDNLNDTISFMISFNGSPSYESSLQMLTADGDLIANGHTIEVIVDDLAAWETVSDEYFVRNNSAIDLNVRMRMEAVSLVDSAEYSFCALGNCFPAGVNETTRDYLILAGVTEGEQGVFTGHYHPFNHAGTSLIRYTFFNVDDLNDTISFMISFNGGSGIGIATIDEDAVITAYPNPASSFLNIKYELRKLDNGYLNLYNAVGSLVLQQEITSTSGLMTLNISELPQGVYLYRFESGSIQSKAYKIIIK